MHNSLAANNFIVAVVANNHFEPGAYSNITDDIIPYGGVFTPPGPEGFAGSMLEVQNRSTSSYEDLIPSKCAKLYNTDYMSSHGNLFLITKHSSNTTDTNTLLEMIYVLSYCRSPSSWMCAYHLVGPSWEEPPACNTGELISNVTSGLPWSMKLTTGQEVEIIRCKSERTAGRCKVHFSLEIMIVVICCNFIKACCMVMAVIRSREPTLVTLGDAMDSFLRIPDQTTIGICFADRRFIEREWRRGCRTEPRQWKQKEVKRWWTSVSTTRWIVCYFFCLIIVIAGGVSLRLGIAFEGQYWNTDIKSM